MKITLRELKTIIRETVGTTWVKGQRVEVRWPKPRIWEPNGATVIRGTGDPTNPQIGDVVELWLDPVRGPDYDPNLRPERMTYTFVQMPGGDMRWEENDSTTDEVESITPTDAQTALGEARGRKKRAAPSRYGSEWVNGERVKLRWVDREEERDDATVVFGEGDPSSPKSGDSVSIEFDDEEGEEYLYEFDDERGYWFEVNNSTDPVEISK